MNTLRSANALEKMFKGKSMRRYEIYGTFKGRQTESGYDSFIPYEDVRTALLEYVDALEMKAYKISYFCKANKNIPNYSGMNKKLTILSIANEIRRSCGE